MDNLDLEKFKNLLKELDEAFPKKERLIAVVITKVAPEDGAYKRQTDNGFFLLYRKDVWENSTKSVPVRKSENIVDMLSEIPIYESEEIAGDVIRYGEILTPEERYSRQLQETYKWIASASGIPSNIINGGI